MNDPLDRATLARLTGVKTVVNTALRWIPPFLPTLERAFGATTAQLTTVLGIGELAGLSTITVGRQLDRGRERLVLIAALGLVATSALIALIGSLVAFAVSFFVLVLGVANYTVAGQAWISRRVDYRRRARALGLFETSWAFALLVGAPLVALLINAVGWRGPFVAVAITATLGAGVIAVSLPAVPRRQGARAARDERAPRSPITMRAWAVMVGSAATAMSGLSVFVVTGAWLDDSFGVSTGGVGAIAVTFGAAELTASLASAATADRVGKLRSTMAGLGVLVAGLAVMVVAGDDLAIGLVGLLVFLLGFEFAFVTSLSLVSEAMPEARGATLAVSNAVGTIARAVGAIGSGWLYAAFEIAGTAALSLGAAVLAVACLAISRSRGFASR